MNENEINEQKRKRKVKNVVFKCLIAALAIITINVVSIVAIVIFADNNATVATEESPEGIWLKAQQKVVSIINTVGSSTVNDSKIDKLAGPCNIALELPDDSEDGYIVKYKEMVHNAHEAHGKDMREDKSGYMSDICTCYIENDEDSGIENELHGWYTIKTSERSFKISGLNPSTDYKIHIYHDNEDQDEYSNAFIVRTEDYGYGDPFKAIDAFLKVSQRDQFTGQKIDGYEPITVKMSSPTGCNGVMVKPILQAGLYSECELQNKQSELSVGTELTIKENSDGHYCYLNDNGTWAVHVKDNSGNEGWVNARTLLIDVKALLTPENPIYGVQLDRTNAYQSIFTAGGSAKTVDTGNGSEEYKATRYDCLNVANKDVAINTPGYNALEGVTGNKLPNYGSKDQMPVGWDLAMELTRCQKSTLENGYTLILYDGYRPVSTSHLVSSTVSSLGYLSHGYNGTNLAQGFLTDQTYSYTFYISNFSRHNKGIAMDLSLVEFISPTELGNEVMMQTKMHDLDFRCNMAYNNWEADLLSDIMMGHGSNLECLSVRSEWWHFQLVTSRSDLYPLINQYQYVDVVF